ncbi:multidrug ABC transporter ATP-binding protein [Mesoplasma entomophilum]|uniref:ABC transporter ATP-binding protein n=1 Tax=Mesoplasma entomophilum TaxID=2149 RepID=UPI000D04303D|nr:ABC transporter ATP-binding protein [Mesoplasma entomophilum]AVN60022.1 multidrug ABC transporter ATP-binding protein [Mesoplasma entomophilum]
MIEIKNISKKFGKNLVLSDINLTIKNGESLALLGSNGSGKTTLLEILIGQIKPTTGSVLIDGKKETFKEIGIQFQEGAWPKGVTPRLIISYFLKKNKILKDPEVNKLIDIFEIREFLKKDLNNLSGGQKQRLNTLLSVINNPNYICLDEMITGLDLKMQLKLIDFFKSLKKQNKTIIVISHNPEEVEKLCDKIVILKEGNIFYKSTTKTVIKNFGSVRNLMINYYDGRLETNVK